MLIGQLVMPHFFYEHICMFFRIFDTFIIRSHAQQASQSTLHAHTYDTSCVMMRRTPLIAHRPHRPHTEDYS